MGTRQRPYDPHPRKKNTYIKTDVTKRIRVITHKQFQALTKLATIEPDEFTELLDVYMQACNGNYSQAARLLGVSRSTLLRWREEKHIPPDAQWYWPMVITSATKTILAEWRKLSSTKMQTRRQELTTELNAIIRRYNAKTEEYDPDIDNPRTYLLSLFRTHEDVSTALIAREGRYSKRTISIAAKSLGLQRRTEGFGENKETLYSLPENDE